MATQDASTANFIQLDNPFTRYSHQVSTCVEAIRGFFIDVLDVKGGANDEDVQNSIKQMAIAAGNDPESSGFDQIGFCLDAAENAAQRLAAITDLCVRSRAITIDPEILGLIETLRGQYENSEGKAPREIFKDLPWMIETVLSYLSQAHVHNTDPQSPISVAIRMLACLMASFHANPDGLNLRPPEPTEEERRENELMETLQKCTNEQKEYLLQVAEILSGKSVDMDGLKMAIEKMGVNFDEFREGNKGLFEALDQKVATNQN